MDPKVIAALAALERDNGRLLPDDVLAAAKNPDSPLHQYFEWDDSIAAERYRRMQASQLIRRIRTTTTAHDIPLTIPKYIRDPSIETGADQPRGFREFSALRKEEDNARAVMVDEMRRISQAIRRAKTMAAALGLIDDIERLDELASSLMVRAAASDQPRGTA